MRSGTKMLRIASLLQIIFGLGYFLLARFLLGLALSNKKSIITVLLGILLFIPVLANFLKTEGNIAVIVVTAVTLVFPYLYLHAAWKNFKA